MAHTTQFRTLTLGLNATLALLATFSIREAHACSQPPAGITVAIQDATPQGQLMLPSNGTVILKSDCYRACGDPDTELDIRLTNEEGATLSGSVIQSTIVSGSGWLVWKPDQTLTPGTTYDLSVTNEFLGEDYYAQDSEELSTVHFELIAGEAAATDVPMREPELNDKWAYLTFDGEQSCCQNGVENSCGGFECSLIATSVKTEVGVYFNVPLEENEFSQFAFAARVTGEDGDEAVIHWDPRSDLNLRYDKGEEYCYEILSLHLATNKQSVLASGCTDNDDIEFPEEDGAIEENNSQAFISCTVPPDGGEDLWCENFRAPIEAGDCSGPGYNLASCEAALATCPTIKDPIDDGAGGEGGDGDDTETGDTDPDIDTGSDPDKEPVKPGATNNDDAHDNAADGREKHHRGCSVAKLTPGGAKAPWIWLLLASSLIGLRRLRATNRASSAHRPVC